MLKFVQWTRPLLSASSSSSADSAEVRASGFSQDDVLPGGERLLDLAVVEVVRRRQMDNVHALVGEELVVAVDHRRELLGVCALGRRADDAGDFDSEPPQGLDVDGADEPRADDACAQVPDAHATSLTVTAILVPRSSPAPRKGSVPSARSCARPSTEQFAGSSPSE